MISFTQCKQIAEIRDLRDTVEALNDQPDWLKASEQIHNGNSQFNPVDAPSVLSMYDIQAINQGGCASGAYMPAVTYYTAAQTMAKYGDDVLQYIQDQLGDLPTPDNDVSWSGLACFYLSYAVELWAGQFADLLDSVDWE